MLIQSLRHFLITTEKTLFSAKTLFWLGLSLTVSVIYSLLVFNQAFDGDYIVQDDARKHIFWMSRFLNPDLFPNDLIADFFQSVEPIGLIAVYRLFTVFNIDPMVINKCLPLGLGMIMTYYCFGICFEVFPIPIAAFIATTLFNQSIWMKDIFVAGSASSFSYPLFLGFLYYFLTQSYLNMVLILFLEGLFYPPCLLLSGSIIFISLFEFKNKTPILFINNKKRYFYLFSLILSITLLLTYLFNTSEFGPIISKAEAITLPEFYSGGRASFFSNNPIQYWFLGIRSGMIPRGILTPVTLSLGLLFPVLFLFPQQFILLKKIKPSIIFIPKLLIISITLFFTAHLLLFRLFLPNRYISHSFYLIIALLAGITITILIDSLLSTKKQSSFLSLLIVGLLCFTVIFYPSFLDKFTSPNYIKPKESSLYNFLSKQPQDTYIASLSEAADNIPSFSKLSVLTAYEYAIPYQIGYYTQIRQRTFDLIHAQYSLTLNPIVNLINQYDIDLILLDSQGFTLEYFDENPWLKQWKNTEIVSQARDDITQGKLPALTDHIKDCSIYHSEKFFILKAACIQEKIN
ncbi:MAG: hypothetical protein WBA77_10025 [Microcoleaceae cyanobacterium]